MCDMFVTMCVCVCYGVLYVRYNVFLCGYNVYLCVIMSVTVCVCGYSEAQFK